MVYHQNRLVLVGKDAHDPGFRDVCDRVCNRPGCFNRGLREGRVECGGPLPEKGITISICVRPVLRSRSVRFHRPNWLEM